MAYNTDSLNVLVPRLGGGEDALKLSSALFVYRSVDAPATVIAPGFITDGDDKGMVVGDGVLVIDEGTSMTSHVVTAVDSAGLVTLSAHVVV